MATTFKVECDHCGNDLTSTSNCEGYRLDLKVTSLPVRDGLVTMMGIYPPIKQDASFCGVSCLRHWMARYHPAPKAEGDAARKAQS